MSDPITNGDVAEQPGAPLPPPTDHPLYQQVETLINQGNWQAAQTVLAELLTLYPDDTHLQDLAASARARSALLGPGQETVAVPARAPVLSRSLRFIIPALILIAVLCIGAAAFVALQQWIIPWWLGQQQELRISQLRDEAQSALASGDYERAVVNYNLLLEEVPGDPQALAGLEQANQLRAISDLYSEAIAQIQAFHWEEALSILGQIEEEQPGYRDVLIRIDFVKEQQVLSALFDDAEADFKQADYEQAIEKYEDLQSRDSGFQRDTVQEHLFLSYLQLGLAEVAAAGNDPEQLQAALDKFEKALALRPNDSQTRGETQLLRLYLAGLEASQDREWAQAVSDLAPVYDARPNFAGGTVSQLLYDAYVGWGDELFAEGEFEQARIRYEEAGQIRGVDTSELEKKFMMVEIALATPTPTPTPFSTVTIPTATPGSVASGSGPAPAPGSAPAPAPLPTPKVYPYTLKNMSVRNNCSGRGFIHGVVWNTYNQPMAGVIIKAFNTDKGLGPLVALPTNADGIYQIIIEENSQIEGMWVVQVFDENDLPASKAWGQRLGGECMNGAQELKTDWQRVLGVQ